MIFISIIIHNISGIIWKILPYNFCHQPDEKEVLLEDNYSKFSWGNILWIYLDKLKVKICH